MTSPKISFRRRRAASSPIPAPFALQPSDDELPPELRDIVRTWRTHLELVAEKPRRQDLRATLCALANIGDDEARAAVRGLDLWTHAQLATAALRMWRENNPHEVPSMWRQIDPDEAPSSRVLDPAAWTPLRLRWLAQGALEHLDALEHLPGGRRRRPRTQAVDRSIMVSLLQYWNRMKQRNISAELHEANRLGHRSFAHFSTDMFTRIGRTRAGRPLGKSKMRHLRRIAEPLVEIRALEYEAAHPDPEKRKPISGARGKRYAVLNTRLKNALRAKG